MKEEIIIIIEQIFYELKQKDRKLSKSRFSREYLGMDRNYIFVCNYSNSGQVSNNALLNLYGNLKYSSNMYLELQQDDPDKTVQHYENQHLFMKRLSDTVMEEIQRRAMA